MPSVITSLNPIRQTSSYAMPVLSPRHTTSTSGSYRSMLSSTSLDRPYFGSTSSRTATSPHRLNSYSERYTRTSYTSSGDDGRRVFTSRHASITEDGVTSRFHEETTSTPAGTSREKSIRRDSVRTNSLRDSSSISRDSSSRNSISSTLSMIESVADLRQKYSPANYVPAVLRKQDHITRSKSINDIGRPPPIERLDLSSNANNVTTSDDNLSGNNSSNNVFNTKKVIENGVNFYNNGLACTNNTNNDDGTDHCRTINEEDDDDYDNNNRKSVAEIRLKYESKSKLNCRKITPPPPAPPPPPPPPPPPLIRTNPMEVDDNEEEEELRGQLVGGRPAKCFKTNTLSVSDAEETKPLNRMSDYASFIPIQESIYSNNNNNGVVNANNDLSTSPRLTRQSATPTPSSATGSPTAANDYHRFGGATATSTSPILRAQQQHHHGLNGLKNIGNTCFMNSVMQCLSNTRYLLEYVRDDAYISDINTTISGMKGALIKAFSQVIQELWSPDSSDRVVNTVSLKSQIQRFAPRFMGYAQQDAQEFLRYLLEGLHEDVNRVTIKPSPILTEIDEKLSDSQKASESWQRYLRMDNSRIVDIFVGQLKSTLKCTHCGHCSVTFDPFWDLSLPIPQRQGQLRLGQCLEHFTREETLDGDEKPTCSKCKERRKCTKSFSIQKFPKILVIHLKRFSPTERFRGKLSIVIDFPLQGLDLTPYASNKGQTDCVYNLYAISNHSGTTYSGHYTAYCKHPYTAQWHEYNDSRVSQISMKNVVSSEAYVLFYELVGQHAHL